MPLSSMTGFARATVEVDGAKFSWELKSVNARGLEVRVRLPAGLDHLETEVRALTRDRVVRGSCILALEREAGSLRQPLVVNEDALALVVTAARRLAAEEGIAMPSADGLLAIPGVLADGGAPPDPDTASHRDAALLEALAAGLDALAAARAEEGTRLGAVIEGQIATIERLVEQAAAVSAEAPEALKARIREQLDLVMQNSSGFDADRLHQEAMLAATRADVREELDRLRSHITGARDLMASGAAVGRRLDFLAQEFNREANTLCSKAFDRRLTTVGIEMKAVIDQLREQVQNLV